MRKHRLSFLDGTKSSESWKAVNQIVTQMRYIGKRGYGNILQGVVN